MRVKALVVTLDHDEEFQFVADGKGCRMTVERIEIRPWRTQTPDQAVRLHGWLVPSAGPEGARRHVVMRRMAELPQYLMDELTELLAACNDWGQK